jgi:hypothetical protein
MLPEEGPSLNVEVSLVTLKLKERIVAYLESRYRKTGTNDAVSWRGIWIESGATEEEFRKALNAAAETGIVFTDSDHIRLRFSARLKNKLLPTNAESSNTTTSEQVYRRAGMFIRLLLQFGNKQHVSS